MHPLWIALRDAEAAWQTEYTRHAGRAGIRPGDYRYMPGAVALPTYGAYVIARTAWHEAGRPVTAIEG
jgi:hypothetical protein